MSKRDGAKRSNPKKSAEKSLKMIGDSKELLKSSAQAIKFSKAVLKEAQERAAQKQRDQARTHLAFKVPQ